MTATKISSALLAPRACSCPRALVPFLQRFLFLQLAQDRDRGEPRGSAPPTPPGIRVRTTAVREVALTRFEQGRETERFEVGIGEPHRERFAPGKVPRTTAAAGHIA